MQVDEALGFADQWIEGVTAYEGLQGWRIVCATLAAEVRQLRSDLALAQGQRDASERALRALVADCLASDFNEHWDSFVVAQDTLEAMPHIEIDASEREVERLRELAAVQAREARLRKIIEHFHKYGYIGSVEEMAERALSMPSDDTILREMIEAARVEEREMCAKEAERQMEDEPYGHAKFRCANIAEAIRARSAQ